MKLLLLAVFVGLSAAASISQDEDSLFFVDEAVEEKPNTFLDRIKDRLNNVVESLKTRAAKKDEVLEEFKEKLQAVKDKIDALAGTVRNSIFKKIREISRDLKVLRKNISKRLGETSSSYDSTAEIKAKLLRLFSQIREILITPEGIKAVRDYARSMEIRHPVIFLVKSFIESASDEDLLEILDEVFKPSYSANYHTLLGELFLEVREILKTDEGFQIVKNYLLNIKSSHPIVSQLEGLLLNTNDETIKEVIFALFPDID